MYSFQHLQELIDAEIRNYEYPAYLPELYEPIAYIMNLQGKRLRPCLALTGCNLFSGDLGAALYPALAIELFHNFTLMHDDIMDNAPLRRGAPTVHRKWNPNTAILSGDVMLVEAYKLMARAKPGHLEKVLAIFSETAALVCEGQQLDMNFEKRETGVQISDYLKMIELKTAVLLGASLKIGAVTGGAGEGDAEALYGFGKNLGIAFQLQDDFLDLYGNPEKFGKRIGGDVLANKKTYLLVKAFELAGKKELEILEHWLHPGTAEPGSASQTKAPASSNVTSGTGAASWEERKLRAVKKVFDDLNIPEMTRRETGEFTRRAFSHLDQVGVPQSRKQLLREFAETLLQRER